MRRLCAAAFRSARGLVLVPVAFFALHSYVPHKELRFNMPVLPVFINERAYQSIPAADRKIMEDTMIEVGRKTLDWDRDTAAKYRKDLEAKGMVFVEEKDGLDVDAFRKAVLAQVNKDFPEWTGYIEQIRAVK